MAVAELVEGGEESVIVPQKIFAIWTTATKSTAANGLGLAIRDAGAAVEAIRDSFPVLPDPPDLVDVFIRLMITASRGGTRAYDGRLAAAMTCHGLTRLLTFNGRDSQAYPDVDILDPHAVAAD